LIRGAIDPQIHPIARINHVNFGLKRTKRWSFRRGCLLGVIRRHLRGDRAALMRTLGYACIGDLGGWVGAG
jgi:hypothetical protein